MLLLFPVREERRTRSNSPAFDSSIEARLDGGGPRGGRPTRLLDGGGPRGGPPLPVRLLAREVVVVVDVVALVVVAVALDTEGLEVVDAG